MISTNRLTIQDYIQKAGLGNDVGRNRTSSTPTPKSEAGSDFSLVLGKISALAQAATGAPKAGKQIVDYQQQPISVRMAAPRLTPALSAGEVRSTSLDEFSIPSLPEDKADLRQEALEETAAPDETAAGSPSSVPGNSSVANRIERSIRAAAAKYQLPTALIRGVIRAESNYQIQAVSSAGAQGLMQLMPDTAEELGVQNPFNIEQNIDGGARYLRQMLDQFGGNLRQALAGYNAGPGAVMRYNGNVPYPETRAYVQKVLAYFKSSAVTL
jgi:soluble lytic murein transglycosylase-like protein